ncbi:glutamine synthetase family protein [Paracoccus sp. SCSIO 75233]|uniref:glutamine synthetase family protein n=1 Tax=Paracoccus sp. SCSIO 75233 TaxID=3017782 RepID=UPI0022F01BBA|nr:glutamine synthetase family protein [Paracoccus sp. SCSIO 75233]WBU54131.1 glutamine synthetase family protein [Paracoccus sp. SCSIO 75233]
MKREEITTIITSDLGGQTRGKGYPTRDRESRMKRGIGWTPTNSMITPLGPIAPSPWGPCGDLALRPDPDTETRVDFNDDSAVESFVIGDILHLDGTPWDVCPRGFLKRVLNGLEERHGLSVKAAFEHEFAYLGVDERANSPYALDSVRRQGRFGETYLGALEQAGITLDTFMAEYGPRQYEVTVGPANGVTAADQAVIIRELARATAWRQDQQRVSFTPLLRPDAVGNGVHVHFSLSETASGRPVNHDPDHKDGLSETAGALLSGMLAKMPAYLAMTASSPVSYYRLKPNRWSAAYNNLGYRDREAGLRICPVFDESKITDQYHFEYRAADATASPYLLLGAILAAGLWGLDQGLERAKVFEGAPQDFDEAHNQALGVTRLPTSLEEALDLFEADTDLEPIITPTLKSAFLASKRFELSLMKDLDAEARCARYAEIY